MQLTTKVEKYIFDKPEEWTKSISDGELLSLVKDTDFLKNYKEQGKDYCYFLNKKIYTHNEREVEYSCMAYTLNEPSNLEAASVSDIVLQEHTTYVIHRIAVVRNGELIDKTPDVNIKVLDDEDSSGNGVLNRTQKINITIKDLRLYDVLVLEDSRSSIFTEKEFLLKAYMRYIWLSPDSYWAYGQYDFSIINDRKEPIIYRNNFFRNEEREIIPAETKTIQPGGQFELHYDNYNNPTDASREIYPFLDFVTEGSWQSLSSYIYPFYDEAVNKETLASYAPELVKSLDEISSLDEKLRYAIEYVQNNIYYLYNAYEMNGHKPQDPAVTYANKQGDCKAKTTLLKVVLDYIGVDSSIVLVNFNTDFYFNITCLPFWHLTMLS